MIIKNLDSNVTSYFKNLPGLSTTWVVRDGKLIGYVHSKGNFIGSVTFPISK